MNMHPKVLERPEILKSIGSDEQVILREGYLLNGGWITIASNQALHARFLASGEGDTRLEITLNKLEREGFIQTWSINGKSTSTYRLLPEGMKVTKQLIDIKGNLAKK